MLGNGIHSLLSTTYCAIALDVVIAINNPLLTWPLGSTTYAWEAVNGQSSSNESSQCGFVFSGSHPDLEYTPVDLNGGTCPFIDLTVPISSFILEFGMAFLIKPDTLSGTLLHYQSASIVPLTVTDVILYLDNGKIGTDIKLSGVTYSLETSSAVISSTGTWEMVGVSKKFSDGKIGLSLSGSLVKFEANGFPGYRALGGPGTVRIGSSFDGSYADFQGQITCLNLFDSFFDTENTFALQQCFPSNWIHSPPVITTEGTTDEQTTVITEPTTEPTTMSSTATSTAGTCSVTADTFRSFRLFGRNKTLDAPQNVIGTFQALSRLRCATICSHTESCIAFVVTQGKSGSITCSLYNHFNNGIVSNSSIYDVYLNTGCFI